MEMLINNLQNLPLSQCSILQLNQFIIVDEFLIFEYKSQKSEK